MIKTNKELVVAAENAARNYKSIYVLGAFGWPMTESNKSRAMNAYSFNRKADRAAAITAAGGNTFGFDCICFIKALLWGWTGDASKEYGGAVYQSGGVPDIGEKEMLERCIDVSEDFSNILAGEYLWTDGHCGIYVGGGMAVECTYKWDDGVQETHVFNITGENGQKGRYWAKHGKLPYITYEAEDEPQAEETAKGDYTLSFRYLRKGCQGEDVSALQTMLKGRGYDLGTFGPNGDGNDGDFGAATESAVRAFQADCEIAQDGIVGEDTMSLLVGV